MTVNNLKTTLMKDIENALQYISLLGPGNKEKQIKVYPQALPITETRLGWSDELSPGEGSNPEDEIFPYAIVRIGETKYEEEYGQATVFLMFGIYNENQNMSGYSDLINVIETIVNKYRKNTVVGEFYCDSKMSVAIQEDDTFPYFFGGIEMIWNLPRLVLEGEYCG